MILLYRAKVLRNISHFFCHLCFNVILSDFYT